MDESAPLLNSNSSLTGYCSSGKNVNKKNENDEHCAKVKVLPSSLSSNNLTLPNITCQTYWYRWYISLIFSLMGMFQGIVWNTWGPVDESAKAAFGFTSSFTPTAGAEWFPHLSGEIELLTNWGPITFMVSMPFFMWCLDHKGLRVSSVSTAFLVALGTGLRCLPLDPSVLRYFIHAGQIFNGIAGCVVMAAPPFLSNIWFPPHERITATGVTTLMNYMGTGVAYSVGMIVDVPSNASRNHSDCIHIHSHQNNTCKEIIHIRDQIRDILYVEFGLALFVFVSMLIFFPSKPPKPPSLTAALPRIDLKDGLLELRHHKQFWVVAIVMALVLGTWSGWTGVIPIILKPLNISQSESGLMGLVMSVAGSITGMLVGWFTDRLKGKMKLMLTVLFSITLVSFIYFIIISNNWIKVAFFSPGQVQIWVVCTLLGILMNASVPVGMEMAADAGYPICEGTSTSIVVWLLNVLSFILLFVLGFLPNPLDANYIIFASLVVSVPALIFFTNKENRRLDLDTHSQAKTCAQATSYGSVNPNYKE